jgi:hypothetical protein
LAPLGVEARGPREIGQGSRHPAPVRG